MIKEIISEHWVETGWWESEWF